MLYFVPEGQPRGSFHRTSLTACASAREKLPPPAWRSKDAERAAGRAHKARTAGRLDRSPAILLCVYIYIVTRRYRRAPAAQNKGGLYCARISSRAAAMCFGPAAGGTGLRDFRGGMCMRAVWPRALFVASSPMRFRERRACFFCRPASAGAGSDA